MGVEETRDSCRSLKTMAMACTTYDIVVELAQEHRDGVQLLNLAKVLVLAREVINRGRGGRTRTPFLEILGLVSVC